MLGIKSIGTACKAVFTHGILEYGNTESVLSALNGKKAGIGGR